MKPHLTEAKELLVSALDGGASTMRRLDDLALAVNILIGLVEGHRHSYINRDDWTTTTGPMQAMEKRREP